jgi:hypothetical protein
MRLLILIRVLLCRRIALDKASSTTTVLVGLILSRLVELSLLLMITTIRWMGIAATARSLLWLCLVILVVARKGRLEANAQSEQADAEVDGRLARAVEKTM